MKPKRSKTRRQGSGQRDNSADRIRASDRRRLDPVLAEARASVSLDGETQFCMACHYDREHICSKRPMTAEERAAIEALMDDTMTSDDWHDALFNARRALRAARKEKG